MYYLFLFRHLLYFDTGTCGEHYIYNMFIYKSKLSFTLFEAKPSTKL